MSRVLKLSPQESRGARTRDALSVEALSDALSTITSVGDALRDGSRAAATNSGISPHERCCQTVRRDQYLDSQQVLIPS